MHRHSVVSHHREILRPSSEYSFLTDDLRAVGINEDVVVSHEGSEAIDIGMVDGVHELKGDFFDIHYLIHLSQKHSDVRSDLSSDVHTLFQILKIR